MDDDWREDGSLRGLNAGGSKEKSRGKGKGPQFTRVIPKFLQKYHQPPAIEAKFATLSKCGDEEDEGIDEVQQAAIDKYLSGKEKENEEDGKVCIRKEDVQGEGNNNKRKRNGQIVAHLGKATASNGRKKKRKRVGQPSLCNKSLLSFSMEDE